MAIDTEIPTPPDLTNRGVPLGLEVDEVDASDLDLRSQELEGVLRDGAWRQGFEEWNQYTDLSADDVRLAEEMELFRALDFYWDPTTERLRYVVPAVPEDWDDRAGDGGLPRSIVQSSLDDLGRTVAETIASDYVDWGSDAPSDLVWSVEAFGQPPTDEQE